MLMMGGDGGHNQMVFDNRRSDGNYDYQRSQAETRALLDVEQSRFEVSLQRLYQSPNCHYFYIVIMIVTLFLVIVTIFKGFKVEENPIFILVESLLNVLIILDFLCRLRIIGLRRFFFGSAAPTSVSQNHHFLNEGNERKSRVRLWNWIDAVVVLGSFILFLVIVFHTQSQPGLTD